MPKQNTSNFGRKMPNLRIFVLEFENAFVIFEISALEFVLFQSLVFKKEILNLGSKMPYLGIFGLEFENNIVIFKITRLEFL